MYIGRKGNFSHFYITKPRQVLVLWSSYLDIRVRIIPPVNVDYQMCEILFHLSLSLPPPLHLDIRHGHCREPRTVSSEQSTEVDRQDGPGLSHQTHINLGQHLDGNSCVSV